MHASDDRFEEWVRLEGVAALRSHTIQMAFRKGYDEGRMDRTLLMALKRAISALRTLMQMKIIPQQHHEHTQRIVNELTAVAESGS